MYTGLRTPPAAYVTGGLACLGGIAVAIIFFRFLLPIDPSRRLRSILFAIVRDLNAMSSADSLLKIEKRRVRMHHRILRMLANAQKLDDELGAIIEGDFQPWQLVGISSVQGKQR